MGGVYRQKSLSDNLAPLERFLRSRVGRSWSSVRSEIAEHLSATSTIKKHVMDHLKDFIAEDCWIDEGDDESEKKSRVLSLQHGRPAEPWRFYVHPRTGLLCETKRKPRKAKSRARIERPHVKDVSGRHLRRVRGIWYEVHVAAIPPSWGPQAVTTTRDAIAKVRPSDRGARSAPNAHLVEDLWDKHLYARSIRQLSKREIHEYLGGK
jgi:hypothetical protein